MLENIYYVTGGIGVFVVAIVSLIFAAGARGVPGSRVSMGHKHPPGSAHEGNEIVTFDDTHLEIWFDLVVANIGRGVFIVDGGGAVHGSGATATTAAPNTPWDVQGEKRSEPFGLLPGEVARRRLERAHIETDGSGLFAVQVLARHRLGLRLKPAELLCSSSNGRTLTTHLNWQRRPSESGS